MKRKIDEYFAIFIEVPINSTIITVCDDYLLETFRNIDNANKTQLKCIETLNAKCDGCYFREETKLLCRITDDYDCRAELLCKATERKDKRNVIFKKIGE